jgi:hypothetical protein
VGLLTPEDGQQLVKETVGRRALRTVRRDYGVARAMLGGTARTRHPANAGAPQTRTSPRDALWGACHRTDVGRMSAPASVGRTMAGTAVLPPIDRTPTTRG